MYGSCSDEMGFIRGYSGLFIETKLRLNCVAMNRCRTVKTINFLLRTNWVHPRNQPIYEFGVFHIGKWVFTPNEWQQVVTGRDSPTKEKVDSGPWICTDHGWMGMVFV